ncbi:MAG: phosphoribosylformylglycinamidine synthase subunit PurL [Candidatus Omnitrophota bacterium]
MNNKKPLNRMYARIEVRDKKGVYDAVAENLKKDIRDLGFKKKLDVEYIQVYTIRGKFSENDAERLAREVLSDEVSQVFSLSFSPVKKEPGQKKKIVEIAYNPGVMDPAAESVLKAAKDTGMEGLASAVTSKKYVFTGGFTQKDITLIAEKLLYNKVIQHISKGDDRDVQAIPYKFARVEIPILSASDRELEKLSVFGQLYLSLAEMKAIRDHFRELGRNPTDCELETLAQTWSEHCKHKTMMGAVIMDGEKIDNLLKETIVKVTSELKKPWCVSVFKDNAGIIRFDAENDICFKVETHNHPSALEPYGGAETGVGGVLRDPMGTGRGAKPIINTDIFCFAPPDTPVSKVPKGALHPKRVMKGVVSGVRDYGNKMGIPTVNGAVCFDERYVGNPLVYCGNVGILPHKFASKKVSPGELIVSVGGRTGRDGIHGATFSSAVLTHESESVSSAAVQIGNPITEKKVLDTLLKARDMELYEAITDCGAGGFSSAVGEMGEKTGADVYLDAAPLKYEGLKPWEIWVSEAQERMVLAVKPSKLKKIMSVFEAEDVEATVIGKFTDTGKLRLYYEKNIVGDISMKFLHDGLPKTARKATWKKTKELSSLLPEHRQNYTKDLLSVLASWNVCSKEWIIRQYDHEVQGGNVLKSLVGPANDGPSDASVTRPLPESKKGIVVSAGINPSYGDIDPYWMAASAIDEAMRQIAAVGADLSKVALLDNFCWANTENPAQLGGLVRASRACYDVAKVYGTPFISGKDSLNNEFSTPKGVVSIPPTLLISAIAVIDDVSKTISMDVKEPGNFLYVLGNTYPELGGSQYFMKRKISGGRVPKLDPVFSIALMKRLTRVISNKLVVSAHDCSDGGLAVALSEMLFAGGYGSSVSLSDVPRSPRAMRDDVILFSESNSRFIVEVPARGRSAFEKEMQGFPFGVLGTVAESGTFIIKGVKGNTVINAQIEALKDQWRTPILRVMNEDN